MACIMKLERSGLVGWVGKGGFEELAKGWLIRMD